jgi:hypothetical protein
MVIRREEGVMPQPACDCGPTRDGFCVAAAVRLCWIERDSDYSRGAVKLLGPIGSRKLSESSILLIKHPESLATREHPASLR